MHPTVTTDTRYRLAVSLLGLFFGRWFNVVCGAGMFPVLCPGTSSVELTLTHGEYRVILHCARSGYPGMSGSQHPCVQQCRAALQWVSNGLRIEPIRVTNAVL